MLTKHTNKDKGSDQKSINEYISKKSSLSINDKDNRSQRAVNELLDNIPGNWIKKQFKNEFNDLFSEEIKN